MKYHANVTAFLVIMSYLTAATSSWSQPVITTEPVDQNIVAGESLTLTVTANGEEPLFYEWYLNGQLAQDGVSADFTLASAQINDAGAYRVVIYDFGGVVTSRVATVTVVPPTLFTRVTDGPVATTLSESTGAVWADFNNDGWLDLYLLQFGYPDLPATNHYFLNNGDGTFRQITQGDFLITDNGTLGAAAMDYDNDGFLDLAVATGGCCDDSPGRHFLLHNNGDGTFARVTAGGIGNAVGHFFATDWADYDNDGFVDALISDTGPFDSAILGANQLWHNSGDGTFTNVTNGPIATDRGTAWGAVWFDYDGDRRMDLLTLNIDYQNGAWNYLYHNEGNGDFTRNLTSPIATDFLSGGCEGADWGDYDNDGLMDLFVADSGGVRSHLYHNNGGGSFSNVDTAGPILTPPVGTQPHGASWGDYDNDGYLDLVVVHADRLVLYRNNRYGAFNQLRGAGMEGDTVSGIYFFNNVTWVDYDNNGFLDLHFCLGHQPPSIESALPNYFYHNAGNSNGWLEVKCVGTVANRAAIGALIRAKATVDGQTLWQTRALHSSAGWDVGKPLVAHFGLGDATNVETLRIEWPSGTVQELRNVAPKQILTVTEPPRLTATKISGQPQFALKGGRNMTYDIEGSSNLHDWSRVASVMITNLNGTTTVMDPGPPAGHRFYRAMGR